MMRHLAACLAIAALAGTGFSAAAAETVSSSHPKVFKPPAKPGPAQPDLKRPVKPRIKPGMVETRCPRYFKKNNNGRYEYDCAYQFEARCGNRAEVEGKATLSYDRRGMYVEYSCSAKPMPEAQPKPGTAPRWKMMPGQPHQVQPDRGQALKPRPQIRKGMSALDCAAGFNKEAHPYKRGYFTCRFRFKVICGPGKTSEYRSFFYSFPTTDLHNRGNNSYEIFYRCSPTAR